MGSSGAFTVCLLKALALATRIATTPPRGSPSRRARSRSTSSRSRSASRTSTSPRTAASAPTRSTRTGRVDVEPLELAAGDAAPDLRNNFLLFYTGEARSASSAAGRPGRSARRAATTRCSRTSHRTKEIGLPEPRRCSRPATSTRYAELMHEHWENKRERSPGMANERIDKLYTLARRVRRGRRQAGRRGRRRLPARLRARGPTTPARRWRAAGAQELRVRLRVPGLLGQRVRVSGRCASRSSAAG